MADVTVTSHHRLELDQVSALCIRRVGDGEELVAVGDEELAVVTAPLDGDIGDDERHAVGDVVAHTGTKSEWEAAATDGAGRVFLIEEQRATIVVLSRDLSEQLHAIHLRADAGPDRRARKLLKGKNRGPEGMVLLAGGHLLVVKQRKPVLLIEFGPAGEEPLGFGPQAQLARDERFALASGRASDLFPLRSWQLRHSRTAGSANDLAFDGEGRLYAVSSRSCSIYELQPRSEDELVAHKPRRLSAAVGADEDRNAEGLAFDHEDRPLVALDVKDSHDNVFVLARL
jgi:hypothetical protein